MKNKPLFKLTVLSILALTGCREDPYVYPEEEVANPPTSSVIYGPGSDGTMGFVDEAGNSVVPTPGTPAQYGSVTLSVEEENGPVRMQVADADGRATLTNGTNVAVNVEDNTALEFDLEITARPDAYNDEVYVSTQQNKGVDSLPVSVLGSLYAYVGAGAKTVTVPAYCFTDAGMDFADTYSPFVLHSGGNLDIKFSNIRYSTYPDGIPSTAHTCDSNLILPDSGSSDPYWVSQVFQGVDGDEAKAIGWATKPFFWNQAGIDVTTDISFEDDSFTASYSQFTAGVNGGIVLLTDGEKPQDLSYYLETGVLEFMIHVNYASHPTKILQVQMEGPSGNTKPHFLPANTGADWTQVRVPLKTLFTQDDGSINYPVLKNITKPLSILPQWLENSSDTLNGMEITVANVKLVNQ